MCDESSVGGELVISQASLRTCVICEFIIYFFAGNTPTSPGCGEECGGIELEQAS